MFKAVKKEVIDQHNQSHKSDLDFDFEYLEKKLQQEFLISEIVFNIKSKDELQNKFNTTHKRN